MKDLDNAPLGLSKMPSTIKVKNWYAQSFQELTELHKPTINEELAKLLFNGATKQPVPEDTITEQPHIKKEIHHIPDSNDDNPAINNIFSDDGIVVRHHHHHHSVSRTSARQGDSTQARVESPTYGMTYFNPCPINIVWPKEVYDYNKLVKETLDVIKKRHDATVATMAQGVQEWKAENQTVLVNSQIQTFLDRFYMSRIGIRMLIGQHIALNLAQNSPTKQRFSALINGSQGNTKNHAQTMLVSSVLIVTLEK